MRLGRTGSQFGTRHEVLEMKLGEDFGPEAILRQRPARRSSAPFARLPSALSFSFIRVFKDSTISSRELQASSHSHGSRALLHNSAHNGRSDPSCGLAAAPRKQLQGSLHASKTPLRSTSVLQLTAHLARSPILEVRVRQIMDLNSSKSDWLAMPARSTACIERLRNHESST